MSACTGCGSPEQKLGVPKSRLAWQRFDDGTWHLRASCFTCGRFLYWAPQTEENVKRADEYREPAPQRGLFDE